MTAYTPYETLPPVGEMEDFGKLSEIFHSQMRHCHLTILPPMNHAPVGETHLATVAR
jgi:hypothetical protein